MGKELAEKKTAPAHSHAGHRERMKNKILREGFKTLYDHELLEVLLFYAVPRQDTNQLAHELIEHFGSLKGLMEADIAEISALHGLGNSSALLIKTTMELFCRYAKDSVETIYYYDTIQKVALYLKNLYIGQIKEASYAMLLDNKMKLLEVVKVGEGSVNSSPVSLRALLEAVIRKNAAAVILSHNHADGILTPSAEDLAVTRQIYDYLRQIGIPLLEHIIISGKEAYPIMQYSAQFDIYGTCSTAFGDEFLMNFFNAKPNRSEII